MNKRIKKLWIEALRSGKYEQGRKQLRDDQGRYCCLGVLCDVYGKTHDVKWARQFGEDAFFGSAYDLPSEVSTWAGLEDEGNPISDPKLSTRRKGASAASLNDAGKSFDYIADRIEKYL